MQRNKFWDYIVVFVLLCISGNPVVLFSSEWISLIVSFFIIIICLFNGTILFNKKFFLWIVGFIVLFVCQYCILSSVSIPANVNFIFKFYACFLITVLLGVRFRHVYLSVIYCLSIISLFFYLLNLLGIDFGYSVDRYKTILIYNSIINTGDIRNSGMFWEPGAFQGYILLAFLLYLDDLKYLWQEHKLKIIVLLLTVLSTQSTTGYIVLAIVFLYLLIESRLSPALKFLTVSAFIVVAIIAFNSFDFLGNKIIEQYEQAIILENGEVSWSRMGAFVIDVQNIARHPIVGNGFMMSARYGSIAEDMMGTGNGFSGVINIFGLPCITLYFISMFNNLRIMKLSQKLLFIILIILLLNGEYFLNYPLFWSLLFVQFPNQLQKCEYQC